MKVLIDSERYEVRVAGKLVNLAPMEFNVLKALKDADGRVVTSEQLLSAIWGIGKKTGVETNSVYVHISRLRRKMSSAKSKAGQSVVTIQRRGYKLVEA